MSRPSDRHETDSGDIGQTRERPHGQRESGQTGEILDRQKESGQTGERLDRQRESGQTEERLDRQGGVDRQGGDWTDRGENGQREERHGGEWTDNGQTDLRKKGATSPLTCMMGQPPSTVASLTVGGMAWGHTLHTARSTCPLAATGHDRQCGGGGHGDSVKVGSKVKVNRRVKVVVMVTDARSHR